MIFRFGEERQSRRVARAIVAARDRGELTDTGALASAVRRAAGGGGWQRIDPATRTFQALRIWVNGELEGLDAFIDAAFGGAAPRAGGSPSSRFTRSRTAIVKHTFRRLAADETQARLRDPAADRAGRRRDRARNPRARSARLRAVEKVA